MPRKGENIFKRKDGRWEARYVRGYELSGKIRYGFCYGRTYAEVKEKVNLARAALRGGTPVPQTTCRNHFAHFCLEWLQIQRSRIRESSYVKYESMMRCHILPKLGACLPIGIDTQLVEAFKAELIDEGLSIQSVKNILLELHSILKYAAAQYPGLFTNIQIVYPREPKKEMRVLTVEEQQRLIAFLRQDMDFCKFGVLLALMTGLRLGEICALRWENISVAEGTLYIDAAMQRIKNTTGEGNSRTKIYIGHPKSDTSVRTIPMPDFIAGLCRKYDPHCPHAYVLTGTEAYMEPRKLQRRLEKYTKACGLEGVHFHTLRHTFATRCIEAGFEVKSLSEVLGHASTSTTLDRYVHSSIDLKRTNMEKLKGMEI